jgi:RNA polymerase sigma-70 factor, ECF subfamily
LEPKDGGLIEDVIKGNLSSFDVLIRKYEKYVYKIAYGFGRSPDNAFDIMQNVFIKVFEKLSTYRQQSSFKSWLGRISYNEGINWVRANKNSGNFDTFDEKNEMAITHISYEDEHLAKENKSALIQSLFTLNTRHRLAVVLRYFENMPIRDIAVTLGCSEGVVKNILFRSLRKLKENLQKKDHLEN